ncbi:MAG TPA: hypothetical protein VJU53_09890 [Burkholderiaceae bacterium]|nr:hypothetical protein [Burkholderiaceae bacterium]
MRGHLTGQLRMKTLFAALIMCAVAFAGEPAFAQDKKSEPTKDESKKPDVQKTDKSEREKSEHTEKAAAKKDEGKKKVKRGGC